MTVARLQQALRRWLRPRPRRSAAEQARIRRQCDDLALYHFPGCLYCYRVKRTLRRLDLPIELRDIRQSLEHGRALLVGGGKPQVPCLCIREIDGSERWLYESAAIVHYLRQRFDAPL